MTAPAIKTRWLPVAEVHVPSRRMRQLRSEIVDDLARSFEERNQLQPIVVRPNAKGYELIAGRHRLAAAKKLGRDVHVAIREGLDADEALLAEIDENLVRADLSPAERAMHQAERKRIYLKQHPQTESVRVRGGPGRGKNESQSATGFVPAFIDDAASKQGKHRATIAREVARAAKIPDIAGAVGTSLDSAEQLDALAKLPERTQRSLIRRASQGEKIDVPLALKLQRRAERERELGKRQAALPSKKYGVILADPEWKFDTWRIDRAPENHYPTSELEVIKKRDVASISAEDAVLFLWATVPMLPQALEVMGAWGFRYVSNFVWRKDKVGTGNWNRNQHEQLLVGTRGAVPLPAPGTQWLSVIDAPRGRHSEKPEAALRLIESYFPNLPKIELNRRGPARPGWDAWGNEATQ